MRRRFRLLRLVPVTAMLSVAVALSAQSIGDTVPRERTVPLRDDVKDEISRSRYLLGPFRLQPVVTVRELGYNNNVFGTSDHPVSDYTSTVAAGVRWITPLGAKLFLRGEVLPEYHWYAHLADERSTGGVYSATALALFNRMSVEGGGTRSATLSVVNTETQRIARDSSNSGHVKTEVDLFPRLSVFAGGATQQHRYSAPSDPSADEFDVDLLNRRDVQVQTGLRYHITTFFDVSAAVESTRSRFESQSALRDNRSLAYLVGLHYDLPRVFMNVSVGHRTGRPLDGSAYPEYSTATGSWFVSYLLGVPAEVQVFGHRSVVNGLFVSNPYYLETRSGLGLNWRAGRRLLFRTYAEIGNNRYMNPVVIGALRSTRTDRATTIGAGFSTPLYRDVWFSLLASRDQYTSDLPQFDRSLLRISTGLTYRASQ